MLADYLDALELREFDEHRFECDAVVVELEERHQRVEQSLARSWLDGCHAQREHELRAVTQCDALPLSVAELSRYLGTDHFGFQQYTEKRQTCVNAQTEHRVDCTDASLIEVRHATELEVERRAAMSRLIIHLECAISLTAPSFLRFTSFEFERQRFRKVELVTDAKAPAIVGRESDCT